MPNERSSQRAKATKERSAGSGKQLVENEKITINLGFVDLGRIDLMVQEGFYANRADFIRTAIRNQLSSHAGAVERSLVRQSMDLGLRDISREELLSAKAAGAKLAIKVVGLVRFDRDVEPDLARDTIASLTVLGAVHASAAVKAALADRIR